MQMHYIINHYIKGGGCKRTNGIYRIIGINKHNDFLSCVKNSSIPYHSDGWNFDIVRFKNAHGNVYSTLRIIY